MNVKGAKSWGEFEEAMRDFCAAITRQTPDVELKQVVLAEMQLYRINSDTI